MTRYVVGNEAHNWQGSTDKSEYREREVHAAWEIHAHGGGDKWKYRYEKPLLRFAKRLYAFAETPCHLHEFAFIMK